MSKEIKNELKQTNVDVSQPSLSSSGKPYIQTTLTTFQSLLNWFKAIPTINHILRAVDRFNDRLGSQFGAAITYFSFLSLIPILMVSFAAVGFILASNPELLSKLIGKIVSTISDPSLAQTLENTVNTAISQRTTVGISGLLVALYSGISWMGNLREAVRAQCRDVWERDPKEKENILYVYAKNLLALTGLVIALVITIALTSVAGSAQQAIVDALGLGGITWLRPVMTAIALTISIIANYLMFLWIFWMLPKQKLNTKALLKGTLIAAIGFELIKFIMTMMLPSLAKSPSGAAFGSIIGLLAFFYFFARLTLFCAAWIATAKENTK